MSIAFGLIGRHLGHSFSKGYFESKFRELRIVGEYSNYELPVIDGFRELRKRRPDLRGVNVTIPYKQSVIPFLDMLDPVAEDVGAVNTVLFESGRAIGFNTDVIGFRDSLMEFYDEPPGGKALVLGTGGASRAIAYVLEHFFQFDAVDHASRNPRAAHHRGYPELKEEGLQAYRLIVNTTPVGMAPNQDVCPDLPYETLGSSHYLYDLIYNPEETCFLRTGRSYGAHVQNGMDMLIRQADASYAIWTEGLGIIS